MGEKYPIRSKSRKKDFKDFIIAQTFRIVIFRKYIYILLWKWIFLVEYIFRGSICRVLEGNGAFSR